MVLGQARNHFADPPHALQSANRDSAGFAPATSPFIPGNPFMKMSSALRVALLALTALAGTISVLGLAGRRGLRAAHDLQGRLDHRRLRRQRLADVPRPHLFSLSTGGLDYGLVFGGSKTVLRGRVSNINRPSDVAGVYGAAGAGLADRPRRPRHRAEQPEGRGAGTVRQPDRPDGERGSQRPRDHDAVGTLVVPANAGRWSHVLKCNELISDQRMPRRVSLKSRHLRGVIIEPPNEPL